MRVLFWIAILALLAGCADTPPEKVLEDDGPTVEVDESTGAIRGVVVDEGIRPVAAVTITLLAAGQTYTTETDEGGEFTFSKVVPGTHTINASKVQYAGVQVPVTVVAGDANPPMLRVQIDRVLEGTPTLEIQKYKGHLFCAYRLGRPITSISSTCVNDYTRLDPTGTCPGGCAPQVTGVFDQRDFQSSVPGGWQSIVWELSWTASSAVTGDSLGITVSYMDRIGASHWYTSAQMEPPFRLQVDVGVEGPGAQFPDDDQPHLIRPEGQDDLLNMISSGSDLTLEQDLEMFQSNFINAPSPEGWSLLNGDENPF